MRPGDREPFKFPSWVSPGTAGRYGIRGIYSDRDGVHRIEFGREPIEGWGQWRAEREFDEWWNPTIGA